MIHNSPSEKKSSSKFLLTLGIVILLIVCGLFFSKPSKKSINTSTLSPDKFSNAVNSTLLTRLSTTLLPTFDQLSKQLTLFNRPAFFILKPPTNSNFSPENVTSSSLISSITQQKVIHLRVAKGDTLSTLFNKAGLSVTFMHNLLESTPKAKKSLSALNIGESFVFTLDNQGNLLSLVYKPSLLETDSLIKQGDDYQFKQQLIKPSTQEMYAHGVIKSSLFTAADKADIPHKMIIEIANAFGYDIDFALDLRQGDVFEVIFEKKVVNGKVVGTGNLLAARFFNQGKTYTAIRYVNNQGIAAYYRADGTSMKKAFIRTPVDFTRISSKFTLGRYHPILNKIRAHKGVDYAAPTGTAIHAAGAGVITFRGVKSGYGNVIEIQHGKTYSTLYGHMSRFAPNLAVGSRVKQSQTIGYVGMTGLATGPHLHYEFRVNGKHVDPLSIKLPMSDPLSPSEKKRFSAISKPLLARMDTEQAKIKVDNE